VESRNPRRGRGGCRPARSSGLALLVGVALSLVAPMPSRADEPPSPVEQWRAYPLPPNAHDAVSGTTAGGRVSRSVGTGGPDVIHLDRGPDTAADSRFQVGALIALLCVAILYMYIRLATTRDVRAVRAGRGLRYALRRLRASWATIVASQGPVARARSVAQRASFTPATASSVWTCEIAWKPGHVRSRFQAVMTSPGDRTRRVVAETKGVRWPPRDVRKPPTRELEAALGALVASVVAAGWKPVESGGPWSERRFVWRREGEPPIKLELSRSRPSPSPARSQRSWGSRGPRAAKPPRRRASRGANREAVLRVVAERPGVTTRELAAASGVKGGTLSALLRTLTQRGELEKRALPGGRTGYALAASAASGEQPPAEPGASTLSNPAGKRSLWFGTPGPPRDV